MDRKADTEGPEKAYKNDEFIDSRDARPVRILAEYLEPETRFTRLHVHDTIVFFGSARLLSKDDASAALKSAKAEGGAMSNVPRCSYTWRATTRMPVSLPAG